MKKEEVMNILNKVMHPEIDASLVELGMIKEVNVKENKVTVTMAFPFPGVPIKGMLIESVKKPLEDAGLNVEIKDTVMDQGELEKFFRMEQEKWKF